MTELVHASDLRVMKDGRCICQMNGLSIDHGERVALVGANGAGKTTLLRVLAALESEYEGTCTIGVPVTGRVYVHQSPYMFRGTVLSNVIYGLAARGLSHAQSVDIARPWLARLGIEGIASQRASHLSGGEKRRVAIARACVLTPALLLLDEPFAELDKSGVNAVQCCLAELRSSTIVVASPNEFESTPDPPGTASRESRRFRVEYVTSVVP